MSGMSLAAVPGATPFKRAASVPREPDTTKSVPDTHLMCVLSFASLEDLGRAACVSRRWRGVVSSDNDRLWTLLHLPNIPRIDETWWRQHGQCKEHRLDPSGAPQLRKETLKAAVAFVRMLRPLVPEKGSVVDLTIPRGLTFDACDGLDAAFQQQFKMRLFDSALTPDELRTMLESSMCTLAQLDHKRLFCVEQTTRLFVTTVFNFNQKEAKPLISLAARVRPLPVGYNLSDSHDRLLSTYASYPLDMSDPYMRFYPGTAQSQRIDYWIRGNGIGSRILIRIVNDVGTNYSQESPYEELDPTLTRSVTQRLT